MNWLLDKDRPIVPQICEQLCVAIASGELSPGERLMSVRDYALNAGVNPNTVQKAFETLEQKELVYSVRGSGWYVGQDVDEAKKTVESIVSAKTSEYFRVMAGLGFDEAATKTYIGRWHNE